MGGFLSHEGGGGQGRFDICPKKRVFLNEGFPNSGDLISYCGTIALYRLSLAPGCNQLVNTLQ